ncbi:competence protein CoiA family protein [Chromobacterium haemolyticum]|uniref:competence protein CoiA family protein n=1 Tax=Chromobacterium haemolyticum TaxID=394935 RepID=UPI0013196153|nr:hypothetical protein [Chromobacterium haemolyticum]BBH12957.1 hypothetical protein CH06BL_22050 [Chromobacterium haemolyticum]
MSNHIPFGLKQGRIVDISEVERGLACECVCTACGGPLIARKGEVNVHHFAHHGVPPCSEALANSISSAVDQLLREGLPFSVPIHDSLAFGKSQRTPVKRFIPDNIIRSPALPSSMLADFLLHKKHAQLAIVLEFRRRLKQGMRDAFRIAKQPAIAINLVGLLKAYQRGEEKITLDCLRKIVITGTSDKSWLYHRRDAEPIEYTAADYEPAHAPVAIAPRPTGLSTDLVREVISSNRMKPTATDLSSLPGAIVSSFGSRRDWSISRDRWVGCYPLEDRAWLNWLLDALDVE